MNPPLLSKNSNFSLVNIMTRDSIGILTYFQNVGINLWKYLKNQRRILIQLWRFQERKEAFLNPPITFYTYLVYLSVKYLGITLETRKSITTIRSADISTIGTWWACVLVVPTSKSSHNRNCYATFLLWSDHIRARNTRVQLTTGELNETLNMRVRFDFHPWI